MSNEVLFRHVANALMSARTSTGVLSTEGTRVCERLEAIHSQEHRCISINALRHFAESDVGSVSDEVLFGLTENLIAAGRLNPILILSDADGREDHLIQGEDYDSALDILTEDEELISPQSGCPVGIDWLSVCFSYIPR